MSESRKPNADPNATMQLALDDILDETIVAASSHVSGASSQPPRGPSPVASTVAGGPLRGVPRVDLDTDDGDAATTIFRDPMDENHLDALKRRLRGELAGGSQDPNATLEYHRIRAVQLDELEGLLKGAPNGAPPDANTTIQLDAVDDGKLDELEASLEVEKRNRGVRKMSPAVNDEGRGAARGSGGPKASLTHGTSDVDADMFVGLGRDIVAAWSALVTIVRKIAARWTTPGPGRLPIMPDDTVPPMSRRAARRRSAKLRAP